MFEDKHEEALPTDSGRTGTASILFFFVLSKKSISFSSILQFPLFECAGELELGSKDLLLPLSPSDCLGTSGLAFSATDFPCC